MGHISISDIEQLLERTVFEALRLETVDNGYLPDIVSFLPNSQANYDLYQAAIQTVIGTKGFSIEIFGQASNHARGLKRVPRMVFESQMFLPGALGGDSRRFYKPSGGGFDAVLRPPQSANFFFNLHLIANTAEQLRTMQAIQALALPRRGYISLHDPTMQFPTDQNIFIRNLAFQDLGNKEEGILEKLYRYEIPDTYEIDDEFLQAIAAINEITLETKDEDDNTLSTLVITPSP